MLWYDEEASPGGVSTNPESTHGSDKDPLEVGRKIRLNLSKEELQQRSADWQPHDATMLRHVCFVGPGEKQLKELDSIVKGRHWIEHSLPTRNTDAGVGLGLPESYDYGTSNEDVASKYPRLDRIAQAWLTSQPKSLSLSHTLYTRIPVAGVEARWGFLQSALL